MFNTDNDDKGGHNHKRNTISNNKGKHPGLLSISHVRPTGFLRHRSTLLETEAQ
jgi:hypothetical protein